MFPPHPKNYLSKRSSIAKIDQNPRLCKNQLLCLWARVSKKNCFFCAKRGLSDYKPDLHHQVQALRVVFTLAFLFANIWPTPLILLQIPPRKTQGSLCCFGPAIMSERDSHTSGDGSHTPTKPKHHGGKAKRFEPLDTTPITSSLMILSCFQDIGCYNFCEKVKQVKYHLDLTRLFACSLQNHQVNPAGVQIELSSEIISKATSIPDTSEICSNKRC